MPQKDSNLKASWAALQGNLADKNINVLSVSAVPAGISIVVEYLLERPRDHKMIWPKTAFVGSDLSGAMQEALETISEIRASEDR